MLLNALLSYLLVINVITFVCYGLDKRKARKGQWRISEATLIWLAVAGGAFGAFLGMRQFHHKTRHLKFRLIIPALAILYLILIAYLLAL